MTADVVQSALEQLVERGNATAHGLARQLGRRVLSTPRRPPPDAGTARRQQCSARTVDVEYHARRAESGSDTTYQMVNTIGWLQLNSLINESSTRLSRAATGRIPGSPSITRTSGQRLLLAQEGDPIERINYNQNLEVDRRQRRRRNRTTWTRAPRSRSRLSRSAQLTSSRDAQSLALRAGRRHATQGWRRHQQADDDQRRGASATHNSTSSSTTSTRSIPTVMLATHVPRPGVAPRLGSEDYLLRSDRI